MDGLGARPPLDRAYGLRTRVRIAHRQGREDRELLRWYPRWQLLDRYAFLDQTTVWEQAWVRRWCATEFRGDGAIVDLGTWLGAISRAVLDGLGDRRAPIWAYDTFRFVDVEERVDDTPLEGRLRDGGRFRDVYLGRMGRGADRLEVVEGDVLDAEWTGEPIEMLFVDLAKEWVVWKHVRTSFLRHLVVGGTLVQQDWAHANCPWLHIWQHRWRDHFEALGPVMHSGSSLFRLVRALPEEAFAPDELADYGRDEVREAFVWAAALAAADRRANVAGAEVMLHAFHGELTDATETAVRVATEMPVDGELLSFALPEVLRRTAAARVAADEASAGRSARPSGGWGRVAARKGSRR